MYCYSCDTRNPDDARFCVICGHALRPESAPTPSPVVSSVRPVVVPTPVAPSVAGATVGGTGGIVQHIYVTMPAQSTLQVQQPRLNILVRAIWFLFVGLWLGQLWLLVAWLLNLTLIGMPLGLWMLNRLPQVMTLRPQPFYVQSRQVGANVQLQVRQGSAAPFVVRAVYFVLIGWWLSLLWLQFAWLFSVTLIGLPLAFLMFERTALVTTLGE